MKTSNALEIQILVPINMSTMIGVGEIESQVGHFNISMRHFDTQSVIKLVHSYPKKLFFRYAKVLIGVRELERVDYLANFALRNQSA